MNDAAYRIDGQLVPPAVFYAAACDPRRSIVPAVVMLRGEMHRFSDDISDISESIW